jgi:hypothetical protein
MASVKFAAKNVGETLITTIPQESSVDIYVINAISQWQK